MSQQNPVPRGDPSAPGAREAVLDCAARLLDEGGQEGLTIRRLAAASGFTPPAIYSLFGDKGGLVDALVERSFNEVVERMRGVVNPGDPREFARAAFREIVRYGCEHHHRFRLVEERLPATKIAQPSVEEARFRLAAPLLELAGADRIDRDHLEVMRQAFWSLLHGLITLPPMRADVAWRDDLADAAFDAMLAGFHKP